MMVFSIYPSQDRKIQILHSTQIGNQHYSGRHVLFLRRIGQLGPRQRSPHYYY